MFRVSAVLRRYDADVPPTAVGACDGRLSGPPQAFSTRVFAAGALSGLCLECPARQAPAAKTRMRRVLFPRGGGSVATEVVASGRKWSAARVGVRGRQERAQARADCLSGG